MDVTYPDWFIVHRGNGRWDARADVRYSRLARWMATSVLMSSVFPALCRGLRRDVLDADAPTCIPVAVSQGGATIAETVAEAPDGCGVCIGIGVTKTIQVGQEPVNVDARARAAFLFAELALGPLNLITQFDELLDGSAFARGQRLRWQMAD
jgi:hypothetical protein